MTCSRAIIIGTVVLVIAAALTASLVYIFKIHKSSDKEDEQDRRTLDCRGKSLCDANAACKADPRDENRYICVCHDGFKGDGSVCRDFNECSDRTHRCSKNARCVNTKGSYSCGCNSGYHGDGLSCSDIDECEWGVHDCHQKAKCFNTVGSYRCSCLNGYHGNGKQCEASSVTNQPEKPNEETDLLLIIIIASVCGVIVIAAFVCCCVCCCT